MTSTELGLMEAAMIEKKETHKILVKRSAMLPFGVPADSKLLSSVSSS